MKCGNKPNCKTKFTEVKHRDGLKYFCSFDCKQEYLQKKFSEEKNFFIEKKVPKKINQVSKTNKNTIAKASKKTKGLVLLRDKRCVFCKKEIQDIHHIFFSNQAEYGEDRNNIDKLIGLCRDCHNKCHSCKKGEGLRQKSIDYVLTYYGK